MIVVLNEWVFHDLRRDNGEDKQREAARFLHSLVKSGDILVVPSEFRWTSKANQLMRFTDPDRRRISKVFRSLYDDSERALRVRSEETGIIPERLLTKLPEKDVYLVSAYLLAEADVLVTTDKPLHELLVGCELVTCRMRADFLSDY